MTSGEEDMRWDCGSESDEGGDSKDTNGKERRSNPDAMVVGVMKKAALVNVL